ncbi:MAG: NUDIX hydrolase [Candidatus Hydrogenedentes bacterium]|nr:NUDIX hydrolase [Candidatus Hydrogenedentota bacterium]
MPSFTYEYPRPALTVDAVVFGLDEEDLRVLLIQRDIEPFEGRWALPGGFVRMDESLEEAVTRELEEETGLRNVYLEQVAAFGAPNRDPRGRVVTIAFYALVKLSDHRVRAATDARNAAWFPVGETPRLAFDHQEILEAARNRLRSRVQRQPVGFELLPEKFALRELQHLYEVILGRKLDKRNFRKKIQKLDILEPLDEIEKDVSHRAAQLFRFAPRKYQRMQRRGVNFQI